ncbi:glycosyltransferase family 39 protein [Actinomadura sp. NBRC 104425]|uniref:glycosyltransferase family 39 protein n=1 Tax=Actinomadura sp. NBRC 104425 TaxID=3032204 RepID=UPI002552649A|nr:glycosyltransferase family 39 protein [Actinomadura sp. NBRC 104425]
MSHATSDQHVRAVDHRAPSRALRLMPLLPAAAALAVTLAGIGGPSFWLDESATVSLAGRPVADLLPVFDRLDLVHAAYYLIMRPWAAVFGTGELSLRLPSALATAAAAAGVAVLGRRCCGPLAGLLAGLAYAGGVTVSRYGQEARSYAMVAAAAVLASYLLVRAVQRNARRPWLWFAAYAPAVVLLGLLNLDGVLLVPAHAVTLLAAHRGPARAGRVWAGWSAAVAVAAVPLVPFGLAASGQKVQIDWLRTPTWQTAEKLPEFLTGGRWLVAPVLALAVLGAVAGRRPRGTAPLTALAVPWLVLPPAVLVVVSLVSDPMYTERYVFFCVPALALLTGAGLARLGALGRPAVGAAAVTAAAAAVAAVSVPQHVAIRRQDSRPDDFRAAAQAVRNHARDGDAIVYLAGIARWGAAAYPRAFGRLRDIGQAQSPVRAENLKGRDLLPRQLRGPLIRSRRVWVMRTRSIVTHPGDVVWRREQMVLATGPWRVAGQWRFRGGMLTLLERTGPYRTST